MLNSECANFPVNSTFSFYILCRAPSHASFILFFFISLLLTALFFFIIISFVLFTPTYTFFPPYVIPTWSPAFDYITCFSLPRKVIFFHIIISRLLASLSPRVEYELHYFRLTFIFHHILSLFFTTYKTSLILSLPQLSSDPVFLIMFLILAGFSSLSHS